MVDAQTEFIVRVGPDGFWTFMNDAAVRYTGVTLAEMRALIHQLRPASLQEQGLVAAGRFQAPLAEGAHSARIAADLARRHGVEVRRPDINLSRAQADLEDEGLVVKVDSAYSDAYSFFPCQEHSLDRFCDPGCRYYAEKMRKRKRRYQR